MTSFDSKVQGFYEGERCSLFDELYAQVNRQALAPFFRPWLAGGGRILDAGAGSGILAGALGLEDACFLDLSWKQIYSFRRVARAGHFIQGDVRCLPFADNTFDRVLCSNVLHYTGLTGLRELVRVTRPGGLLLVAFLEDSRWTRTAVRMAVLWGWFPPCFLEAPLMDTAHIASLALVELDSVTVVGFPGFFFAGRSALRRGLVAMILKKGSGKG